MKKVFLTIIILFSVFMCKAQTTLSSPDTSVAADIKFKTLTHDYGTVNKGANGNCEFTFTNTGNEPLVLSNVTASCGCTIPSWTKEPIMPGKTGVIKVSYTRMDNPGTFSKQITVISNAKSGTIVLNIMGTILDTQTTNTPEKPVNDEATPIAK